MRPKRVEPGYHPLRRKLKLPVWADIFIRLGLAIGLVALVVTIHWFDREGLRDSHDGHDSLLDVVYFKKN